MHVRASSETGAALITVLLLLIIVSAVSAAVAVSSRTELVVSGNRESAAQARAAAEAALNHAADLVIPTLRLWDVNGFPNASAAISRLLRGPDNAIGTTTADADNGSLESLGIPRPPARAALTALPNVGYEARLFDEDDPGRGLTLSAADRTAIGEDGQRYNDTNGRLLIRATGYADNGSAVTLEALVGPVTLPAIVSDGDLTVTGNAAIAGMYGSVHSNEDLTVWGSAFVARDATSTGTYAQGGGSTVGGVSGGGRPVVPVGSVRASDYRTQADFILESDGRVTNQAGTELCNAAANPGSCSSVIGPRWQYDGPGWSIGGSGASSGVTDGTYYVEGPVNITSSPGTPANPIEITIIAEGSIDISGSPDFTPDTTDLMFVTDGDLRISGSFRMAVPTEGRILVREQLSITGNARLFGQISVDNATNTSSLVTSNLVTGSSTITYNGLNGSKTFAVLAWREVR